MAVALVFGLSLGITLGAAFALRDVLRDNDIG